MALAALVLFLAQRDEPEPVAKEPDPNRAGSGPLAIEPPDELALMKPAFPPAESKLAGNKEDEPHRVFGNSLDAEPVVLAPPRKRPSRPAAPKPPPPQPPPPPPPPPEKPLSPTEAANAAFEKHLAKTDADLRQELRSVPELQLLTDIDVKLYRDGQARVASQPANLGLKPRIDYAYNLKLHQTLVKKAGQQGLPLLSGRRARLNRPTALIVQWLSTELRGMGFVSVPGVPANVIKVKEFKVWCDQTKAEKYSAALSTLLQMLQVEDTDTRRLLVREMAKAKSPASGAVLATRALTDLSPEVRQAAVRALKKRPTKQYQPLFLNAFRYPWPSAADHAAEALIALDAKDAVPQLVALLDQPDPALPVLDSKTGQRKVRELVRLNHLRNCFLCHPPSASEQDGLVRGAVPTPGVSLAPVYYGAGSGDFARADITFLRQDFSVILNVDNAAPWPAEQRFDYLVRTRTLPKEAAAKEPEAPALAADYPQRQAALYALRKLTGKDGGTTSDEWRKLLELPSAEEKAPPAKKDPPAKEKIPDL